MPFIPLAMPREGKGGSNHSSNPWDEFQPMPTLMISGITAIQKPCRFQPSARFSFNAFGGIAENHASMTTASQRCRFDPQHSWLAVRCPARTARFILR